MIGAVFYHLFGHDLSPEREFGKLLFVSPFHRTERAEEIFVRFGQDKGRIRQPAKWQQERRKGQDGNGIGKHFRIAVVFDGKRLAVAEIVDKIAFHAELVRNFVLIARNGGKIHGIVYADVTFFDRRLLFFRPFKGQRLCGGSKVQPVFLRKIYKVFV